MGFNILVSISLPSLCSFWLQSPVSTFRRTVFHRQLFFSELMSDRSLDLGSFSWWSSCYTWCIWPDAGKGRLQLMFLSVRKSRSCHQSWTIYVLFQHSIFFSVSWIFHCFSSSGSSGNQRFDFLSNLLQSIDTSSPNIADAFFYADHCYRNSWSIVDRSDIP